MEGRQLGAGIRTDLRFFAYYLGNQTLLLPRYSTDLHYEDAVIRGDDTVGRLFAIVLSDYRRALDDDDLVRIAHHDRAQAWLAAQCDPLNFEAPELTGAEQRLSGFDEPWKDAVVDFARKVGRGTLAPEVVQGEEYVSGLAEGGSFLESIVAVYANVLRVDGSGRPTNADHAERRAAWRLRLWFDPDHPGDPPLQEWECELV
jgi:hypothetical protein